MKKVLIVEDSPFTASIMESYLHNNAFKPCGIAANFKQAKKLFLLNSPSIILCDIHLEGAKSGIEFACDIKKNYPSTIIVFVSADMNTHVLHQAQQTKPDAYLTKPFTEEQLITALELANIERTNNNPSRFGLNGKDIEVLKLIGDGQSNKQIGDRLFISPHTVDSRRRKILSKLNVSSINRALCIASEKGWLFANKVQLG